MTYQHPYYLLQYLCYRENLNCCLIYRNYYIQNCIDKNYTKIKKNNYKFFDNSFNTKSTYINEFKNTAITKLLLYEYSYIDPNTSTRYLINKYI